MTDEVARFIYSLLTNYESWPIGYEGDGFHIDGWEFHYYGGGDWRVRKPVDGYMRDFDV